MFHIGRTSIHRDFQWAVRAIAAPEWVSLVDTSGKIAAMLGMRQNPMRVARSEPYGCEATAVWMAEVKSSAFDYAGQMEATEA